MGTSVRADNIELWSYDAEAMNWGHGLVDNVCVRAR